MRGSEEGPVSIVIPARNEESNIARAVRSLAVQAGVREIVVVDDRESFANLERFPMASKVFTSFEEGFDRIRPDGSTYLVIVTRGHRDDMRVLKWAVGTEARYIGMIGSRAKCRTIFEHLFADGYSETDLGRVFAPIGLDLGGDRPQEIAIAILAEIIAVRCGRDSTKPVRFRQYRPEKSKAL